MEYLLSDKEKELIDTLSFGRFGTAHTTTASGRAAEVELMVDLSQLAKWIEDREHFTPKRPRFMLYVDGMRQSRTSTGIEYVFRKLAEL